MAIFSELKISGLCVASLINLNNIRMRTMFRPTHEMYINHVTRPHGAGSPVSKQSISLLNFETYWPNFVGCKNFSVVCYFVTK